MHRLFLLIAAAVLSVLSFSHSTSSPRAATPRIVLWAWERPEDLRFLAGRNPEVAFLDRTVTLRSGQLSVQRRHQPLRLAPDTVLTSVVRIETNGVSPSVDRASGVAREIADSAVLPRVGTVQIDFDARGSDRPFYAALLRETRARLPRSSTWRNGPWERVAA